MSWRGRPNDLPGQGPLSDAFKEKELDQAEKDNPYKYKGVGIPKDLPNRGKSNQFLSEVDEKEAEESLSLYCKPVELYNIIQQRCEQQPPFLQRCLSYKIRAAHQRKIRMCVSVKGYTLGKVKGKGSGPSTGLLQHMIFVMVTKPAATSAEGKVVYQLRQAQVLHVGGNDRTSQDGIVQGRATFVLPELRKLEQDARNGGDVVLFVVDTRDSLRRQEGATLSDCIGRVAWGTIPMPTLCSNWSKNSKESGQRKGMDSNGSETMSQVDVRQGLMQLADSTAGKVIKISNIATPNLERCLVQLQVQIMGGEVGQTGVKTKLVNGTTTPKSPQPYSLSWRARYGRVVFHYLYYHGMLRKTEVTEDFSCPFCLSRCSSFKGLRSHLNATHDLFKFEYMISGELQYVTVTCRPDPIDSQGTILEDDELGDPRVKNFSYWYRGSRLRKRRLPVKLRSRSEDVETTSCYSRLLASRGDAAVSEGLQQDLNLHQEGITNMDCSDMDIDAGGLANWGLQRKADSSVLKPSNATQSSSKLLTPSEAQKSSIEDSKGGKQVLPQHEQKEKSGRSEEVDGLGQIVKQRSLPALKRQRMKGVLGERGHSRWRSSPTFGGACASAGGQELDDCYTQGSTISFKGTSDRSDLPRSHSLLKKRQYFHSHTAQLMDEDQLFGDRDSEDEIDASIADLEDQRMLDDFVDVTTEEKEVMHLWNSFVRRNRVIADGHCPWGCEQFSRENAERFRENPALRRCLMLFLVKLWNHHLVDGATVNRCLTIVDHHGSTKKGSK